jgi:hypothetical protein
LDYCKSDHRAILLDTEFQNHPGQTRGLRRFEAKWFQEKNFKQIVERAWVKAGEAETNGGVLNRLGRVHDELHEWNNTVLKKSRFKIAC